MRGKLAIAAALAAASWFGTPSVTSAALLINEMDSDSVNTPTTDAFEFVEIYETTGTSVALDGLVLVFYNGNGNVPYRVQDLDGFSTNSSGYFVAGSVAGAQLAIPGNTIQNGVDAIALYTGNGTDFVTGTGGTAPSKTNLIDAVVYKTGADTDGVGLDTALLDAGSVLDEFSRDGTATQGALDSLGRIPNGAGAARDTTSWTFMSPTPGAENVPVPEPTALGLLALGGAATLARRRR
jgi:hypothetical protein